MVILERNGEAHVIGNQSDLRKAMGIGSPRTIIMTDESGALVAAGAGTEALQRSATLVKAMNQGKSLLKASGDKARTVFMAKKAPSGFEALLAEVDALQKAIAA